ncbi:MAG: hypothetical protein H3C68_04690 [Deltaproteobacteria bacterium]|nr:hypothetical protein [Deltaproteobacteria bacterium]MBZ0220024.1 hypothetical protein [Deltaproteobacteria bacterium]
MRIAITLLAASLLFSAPDASAELGERAIPVQLPPEQEFRQPVDPFLAMEREQLMQETLIAMRELIDVIGRVEEMPPDARDRLAMLSDRMDFLITRQQDLAMRQRLGMR